MAKESRRLGRGLASLVAKGTQEGLEVSGTPRVHTGLRGVQQASPAGRFLMLQVDRVKRNPMQPRRQFDDDSLSSLAQSIRDRGTLQPILVRPAAEGYELVAGERRLRAARLAGLAEIPAIVRSVDDEDLLELALVENIQRADLNPIERARAYRVLQDRHNLSHEQIAQRMGEDRATVSNYIRLLGLGEDALEKVASGELTMGHAKVILGIQDIQLQNSFIHRVIHEGWSVRRLETAVANLKPSGSPAPEGGRRVRSAIKDLEQRLCTATGTRVTIREGRRRHTGKIVIEYYSLDDFERIAASLGIQAEDSAL